MKWEWRGAEWHVCKAENSSSSSTVDGCILQEWQVDVAVALGSERYHEEPEVTDAWSAGKSTAGARALRLESSTWVPISATGRRSLGAAAEPVRPLRHPPPTHTQCSNYTSPLIISVFGSSLVLNPQIF